MWFTECMSATRGSVVRLLPLVIASGILIWAPATARGALGLPTTDAPRLLAPQRGLSTLVVGRNLVELAQESAPSCTGEDESTAGCIEQHDSDEGDTSLTPQSQPTGGGALCCQYANVGATPIEQCTNRLTCPTPGTPIITDIRCETQRCPATRNIRVHCLTSNGSQAGPGFKCIRELSGASCGACPVKNPRP